MSFETRLPLEIAVLMLKSIKNKDDRKSALKSLRLVCREFRWIHLHLTGPDCDGFFPNTLTSMMSMIDAMYKDRRVTIGTVIADFTQFWGSRPHRCPVPLLLQLNGRIAATTAKSGKRRSEWKPLTSEKTPLKWISEMSKAGFKIVVDADVSSFKITQGIASNETFITGVPEHVFGIRFTAIRQRTNLRFDKNVTYPNLEFLLGAFCGSQDSADILPLIFPKMKELQLFGNKIFLSKTTWPHKLDSIVLAPKRELHVHRSERCHRVEALSICFRDIDGRIRITKSAEDGLVATCDTCIIKNNFIFPDEYSVDAPGLFSEFVCTEMLHFYWSNASLTALSEADAIQYGNMCKGVQVLHLTNVRLRLQEVSFLDSLPARLPDLKKLIVVMCHTTGRNPEIKLLNKVPETLQTLILSARDASELLWDVHTNTGKNILASPELKEVHLRYGEHAMKYTEDRMKMVAKKYMAVLLPATTNLAVLHLVNTTICFRGALPASLKSLVLVNGHVGIFDQTGSGDVFPSGPTTINVLENVKPETFNMLEAWCNAKQQSVTLNCNERALTSCCVNAALGRASPSYFLNTCLVETATNNVMEYVKLLSGAASGSDIDSESIVDVCKDYVLFLACQWPYSFSKSFFLISGDTLPLHVLSTLMRAKRGLGSGLNDKNTCKFRSDIFSGQTTDIISRALTSNRGSADCRIWDPFVKSAPVRSVLAPIILTSEDKQPGSMLETLSSPATVQEVVYGLRSTSNFVDAILKRITPNVNSNVYLVVAYSGQGTERCLRPGVITVQTFVMSSKDASRFGIQQIEKQLSPRKLRVDHIHHVRLTPDATDSVLLATHALSLSLVENCGLN